MPFSRAALWYGLSQEEWKPVLHKDKVMSCLRVSHWRTNVPTLSCLVDPTYLHHHPAWGPAWCRQSCQRVGPLGLLATELKILYGKVCGLYCVGVLMDMFIIVGLLLRWSGERFIPESNQESTVEQETCSQKVAGPLRTKWVSCHLGNPCLPAVCWVLRGITSCLAPGCPAVPFLRHARPCAVSLSEPGSCFYSRSCSRCRDCIYLLFILLEVFAAIRAGNCTTPFQNRLLFRAVELLLLLLVGERREKEEGWPRLCNRLVLSNCLSPAVEYN